MAEALSWHRISHTHRTRLWMFCLFSLQIAREHVVGKVHLIGLRFVVWKMQISSRKCPDSS